MAVADDGDDGVLVSGEVSSTGTRHRLRRVVASMIKAFALESLVIRPATDILRGHPGVGDATDF